MAGFRTPGIRGEFRDISKTYLQTMKRNTYFISKTSSKCFLLSARRLVKWVSFSAKDCCVEDNFAFIDSSSCLTFSMAIINSSTWNIFGEDRRREKQCNVINWNLLNVTTKLEHKGYQCVYTANTSVDWKHHLVLWTVHLNLTEATLQSVN